MIQELSRHGYRLGPGTLYPLLHGMEAQGLLRSKAASGSGRPAAYTPLRLQAAEHSKKVMRRSVSYYVKWTRSNSKFDVGSSLRIEYPTTPQTLI